MTRKKKTPEEFAKISVGVDKQEQVWIQVEIAHLNIRFEANPVGAQEFGASLIRAAGAAKFWKDLQAAKAAETAQEEEPK